MYQHCHPGPLLSYLHTQGCTTNHLGREAPIILQCKLQWGRGAPKDGCTSSREAQSVRSGQSPTNGLGQHRVQLKPQERWGSLFYKNIWDIRTQGRLQSEGILSIDCNSQEDISTYSQSLDGFCPSHQNQVRVQKAYC